MAEEKKPNEELENHDDDDFLDPNDFDDDVDDPKDTDNPEDDDKTKGSQNDDSKSDDDSEKAKKDAHFAKLRREREAREKEAKEKREREDKERKIREEAKLEAELGLLKTNPYTNEPIRDAEDLKIYKLQKELEDEGKDPVNDLGKKIAELNRKEANKRASEEAERKKADEDKRARIDEEIKELRNKYPKVDTAKLAADPLYKECLQGRAGRWTQVEIYELYLEKKAEADKKEAEDKTKKKIDEASKQMTKTPRSGSTIKTASDIASMSDEEFDKYWEEKYS